MPYAWMPSYRFRIDREGYQRCWQLLLQAGIKFVEERRTVTTLGTSQQQEICVYGELHSERGSAGCDLRAFGEHFKLKVYVLGDPPPPIVDDIESALGAHLLKRY
jgi:hypothetical protein